MKSTTTTYACDHCRRTAVVEGNRDRTAFKAAWYSSSTLDLCPDCCNSLRGRGRILIDRKQFAGAQTVAANNGKG